MEVSCSPGGLALQTEFTTPESKHAHVPRNLYLLRTPMRALINYKKQNPKIFVLDVTSEESLMMLVIDDSQMCFA